MLWRLRERTLDLSTPRVMAIINATPDSFFAGSRTGPDSVADIAARALAAGANILDIGGESTRPGAPPVDAAEQIRRVVPAIRTVRAAHPSALLSVDTTLSAVAREALDAGADAINDVSAAREDPEILALAAGTGCGLVLMHRLTLPARDRYSDGYATPPAYTEVVSDVKAFLAERTGAALRAGVSPEQIVVDPGLGFGKSVGQNLELIRRTGELASLGRPVVSALSRKSFVGRVSLGRDSDPAERLAGTLALSVAHLAAGARLFRVHDVREHAEALRAAWAARPAGPAA
jgi:dihydropteroate synthase